MNAGTPKLLVIPTPSASLEGGEAVDSQEDEEWSSQRKKTLQMRVTQLAREAWVLLSAVPGWIQSLPSYWCALRAYCVRRLRRRVQPDSEEVLREEEGSGTLTPTLRFNSDSPLNA